MTDRSQQHLAVQYAVARALAGPRDLAEAGSAFLAAIADALDLDAGFIWLPSSPSSHDLEATTTWLRRPDAHAPFVAEPLEAAFGPGRGLPERVLETGRPASIDLASPADWYVRCDSATAAGIVSGFAFPILRESAVLGVVEFYASSPQVMDVAFLESMRSVGSQLGQFMDRSRAEQAVRESEARQSAILEAALDCIITIDHRGTVLEFNPAAAATFGYRREDAIGRELAELIVPPSLRGAHREGMARYLASGVPRVLGRRIEIEAMRADGSTIPVELAISRVDVAGAPIFTAYVRDITERRASEREAQEAKDRYRTMVERLPAIVYVAEAGGAGRWSYVSPQIETILGFTVEEWLADPELWARQLHPDDREAVIAADDATLARPDRQTIVSEYRIMTKSGAIVWVRDEMVPVAVAEGRPTQIRGVMVDVTERKLLEGRLTQHAFYDPLTGLPNRVLFLERLEHALARRERSAAQTLAVLFIDVDDFKVINDTLGHGAGDLVLAAIGERLAGVARRIDTPARFGGDEFTLLIEDLEVGAGVVAIAARVADLFGEPFRVNDIDLTLSASIGIAVAGDVSATAEELVRHADIAMYRAKENGKARYEIYHEQLSVEAWRRLELEGELRRAIERDELRVFFQPIVDLVSRRMTAVEALVRWEHPSRGLLAPAEFVPFAESNGLIVPIDLFVLSEACNVLAAWSRDVPAEAAELSVNVNLSAREFRSPGIVESIADILATSGLEAHRLKIEITESVTMLDGDISAGILAGLGGLGVRLVIDDFGVGYSGLDYVKRFAVDALKIDRSFVAGLGRVREDTAIVSATIAFARALGLSVTAEGIETEDQLRRLTELGCESGQGYLFAPPMPALQLRHRFIQQGAA